MPKHARTAPDIGNFSVTVTATKHHVTVSGLRQVPPEARRTVVRMMGISLLACIIKLETVNRTTVDAGTTE